MLPASTTDSAPRHVRRRTMFGRVARKWCVPAMHCRHSPDDGRRKQITRIATS